MPAVETDVKPAEEAASDDKAALLKAQAGENGGENGAPNGDSQDEVKRLREENEKLNAKVAEQEKEIEGLKADVQKYKEEAEGKRKRTSSTSKSKSGGLFGRRRKQAEEQGETTPEGETAPQNEEAAGTSGEEAGAATGGEESGPNETDNAAAESDNADKTPKKKSGGIKDRLGRAFGRFRHPKGYEETPKDEPEAAEAAAKPEEFQIPERKEVTWTVAKSFEKPPQPAEAAEGAEAEAAAQPEGETVVPFKDWTVEAVREWLTDLQLERYAEQCQWTGEQMLKTTDAQFEKDLGVRNLFHRKKLRLTLNAIASGTDLPKELLDWDVKAVAELLQYHGIPQNIVELFVEGRIDGRVMHFLTMDDMNAMKIIAPYSQACVKRAIQLWRQQNYGKDYMKKYIEPEPLPVPDDEEEAAPAAEAAAEESKPEEKAAGEGEQPAAEAEEKKDEKPAEGEEKEKEKTDEEKKAEEEKAAAEKKAEEEKKAAEEAKKKEEAEKRKAEAAKQRQQQFYELSLSALKEQKEIVTWSNTDVTVWARAVGLAEQAEKLLNTGMSGALIVLDPCCTAETLCSALAVGAKDNATRELVAQKLAELLGEEVMGQKSEASKLDNYAPLIPGARPKRKRTLSFSGALRRKQRGEKPAPPSIYLCSMDDVPESFVEAHTKDCSIPPPAPPAEEPAPAEAAKEEEKKDEEKKEEGAESPKTDEETAPLVKKDKEEEDKKAEPAQAADEKPAEKEKPAAEEEKPAAEEPAAEEPAEPEEKKEEEATEKSKLLEEGEES